MESNHIKTEDETNRTAILPETLNTLLLTSALECMLCLQIICEPITTPCGHTFCRVCLVKALRRHKKQCPSCREVCHISAENASENIMIKSICLIVDPMSYNLKLEESRIEKESWNAVYPIFYYNQAMFPGSRLDLHLFEPRYKIMMQRVVATTRSFAYVPNFTNYKASVGDIALIAEVKDAEFTADGRCLLSAKLLKRKRIIEHFIEDGTQGLHFCCVENYQDEPLDGDKLSQITELSNLAKTLAVEISKIDSNVEYQYGPMPNDNDIEGFSLWLVAISPLQMREKFNLFKSRDTHARIEICIIALSYITERLKRSLSCELVSQVNTIGSSIATTGLMALNQITAILGRRSRSEDHTESSLNQTESSGEVLEASNQPAASSTSSDQDVQSNEISIDDVHYSLQSDDQTTSQTSNASNITAEIDTTSHVENENEEIKETIES